MDSPHDIRWCRFAQPHAFGIRWCRLAQPPVSVGPSIRSRRDRSAPRSLVLLLVLLLLPAIAQAAPPQAALDESHRTFLREHCTACHNADKQKGKVRLDDIAFTLVTARTALVVLAFQKSQFQ